MKTAQLEKKMQDEIKKLKNTLKIIPQMEMFRSQKSVLVDKLKVHKKDSSELFMKINTIKAEIANLMEQKDQNIKKEKEEKEKQEVEVDENGKPKKKKRPITEPE